MRKLEKENKGITLIALIITIVILIILATVSINVVLGDGGIIVQAELATQMQANSIATEKEAMNELLLEYESILGNGTSNEEGTAADLVNNAENILGATVNYDTGTELATDITWRIFYIDENNIYLIAADYVLAEDAPETSSGYSSIYSGYPYNLSLYDVNSDYAGSADWDSIVSYWNSLYLASYASSTCTNAQETAYLLDTSIWNTNFAQSSNAEYAIGGPTIEMWVASWNQHGYTTLYCNNISKYGYYIGTSDTPTSLYQFVTSSYVNNSGYDDTLYFPDQEGCAPDGTTSYGYWIASPSGTYDGTDTSVEETADNGTTEIQLLPTAITVYGSGESGPIQCAAGGWIGYMTELHSLFSFRPVVCLKTSVSLTLEEDGTYSIN